ncbi:4-diphosphocytidyl-2-C-methyl-D-erythritol kinase IspE [Helicobacter sp. NHP19-012]|uniref:4-diphosphocytidyl-2-C-methyl-D-erythritol kinase n=1 Tax=Helicobacter gastrofelis TaxID=2849642 RepID=A0ABM7SDP4_9HELI|nr:MULTISPECIES: 4-(cytidine 5'-diphospho)-2-C-methyl-D-erythritol kinase [unclassified Helicobacter]BCZ18880.1 4-diphosphocytidyl-2-C-methyl-D-erythritol kinase IspE [Helicobacter sp. NHP19-012]GMB96896.1 4-diphosphocytidyl-2-C-methyl-D-erythritol kinase IspE [Helicobacter sp. NHP22-001]
MIFSCPVYPKVNVFLKVVGKEGQYHLLHSRLCVVQNLHDVLCVKSASKFSLKGDFGCALEQNTLYKAWQLLKERVNPTLRPRLEQIHIEVEKHIPLGGGLGGSSANAGVFLREVNQHLELGLSLEQLYTIGTKVGADVNFFISGFASANVSHFGEVVRGFSEPPLEVQLGTPPFECSTARVYQAFSTFTDFNPTWLKTPSKQLLQTHSASDLNDLLTPALECYPALKEWAQGLDKNYTWFFSGSGASFFGMRGQV